MGLTTWVSGLKKNSGTGGQARALADIIHLGRVNSAASPRVSSLLGIGPCEDDMARRFMLVLEGPPKVNKMRKHFCFAGSRRWVRQASPEAVGRTIS